MDENTKLYSSIEETYFQNCQYSAHGNPNITPVFKQLGNLTNQNLYLKYTIYHKVCYSNLNGI